MPSDTRVGKPDDSINGQKLCREDNPLSNQSDGITLRLSRLNVECTFSGGYANNPKLALILRHASPSTVSTTEQECYRKL